MGKSKKVRGVVLYRGRSRFDGRSRIVVVATFDSKNAKTGNMVQTWILLESSHPAVAVRSGKDGPICGSCPYRSGQGCYVSVGKAPAGVWRGVRRGIYPVFDPVAHAPLFAGRRLRIGSYGDPAAVPVSVWESVLPLVSGHTGYTHAWAGKGVDLRGLLQASCDSLGQAETAQASGWKSFTVVASDPGKGSPAGVECVNSSHGRSCLECKLCDGAKTNIWIEAHGTSKKRAVLSLSMVR